METTRALEMTVKDQQHAKLNTSQSNEELEQASLALNASRLQESIDKNNKINQSDGVYVDISPAWKEAAERIDVTNSTADEIAAISSILFNAKAITFEDHVNLSFQSDPTDEKKKNHINFWQHRQEDAINHGASRDELNDIIRIQSILNFVDSLKQ